MAEDRGVREGRYPASWQEARWAIATELQNFSDTIRELRETVKDNATVMMTMRDRLLVMETRLAIYAVVGGCAAGGIMQGLFELFKKYL